MEMTNYLSAEELGIQEWERNSLIELITVLPTLAHADTLDVWPTNMNMEGEHLKPNFNLNITATTEYECGAVCCIGGWVRAFHLGVRMAETVVLSSGQVHDIDGYVTCIQGPLRDLYFPEIVEDAYWDQITPEMAATVIDTFLQTGIADYAAVVPSEWLKEDE